MRLQFVARRNSIPASWEFQGERNMGPSGSRSKTRLLRAPAAILTLSLILAAISLLGPDRRARATSQPVLGVQVHSFLGQPDSVRQYSNRFIAAQGLGAGIVRVD